MLENRLQSCFNLEVGRCGHGNGQTNDHAVCDYFERSHEQKMNGVRRQNALSAYSYPVLPYLHLELKREMVGTLIVRKHLNYCFNIDAYNAL